MIEFKEAGENRQSPCRIPNNLCRYSIRKRNVTPYSLSVRCMKLLPLVEYSKERRRKSNVTVEKPDRDSLSQVIKVNINSDTSC